MGQVTLVNPDRPGVKWSVPEGMAEAAIGNGNGWVREADAKFETPPEPNYVGVEPADDKPAHKAKGA